MCGSRVHFNPARTFDIHYGIEVHLYLVSTTNMASNRREIENKVPDNSSNHIAMLMQLQKELANFKKRNAEEMNALNA